MLSIILPTKDEAENIKILIEQIDKNIKGLIKYEIIVVDAHSKDGTDASVKEMISKGYPVTLNYCPNGRGLAVETYWGMSLAKYDLIGVMDTDLQHDPIYLPGLIKAMEDESTDMVIGSRYIAGGSLGDWAFHRVVISKISVFITKLLTGVHDPITQYYIIRKKLIESADIQPVENGMRLTLELLVKCNLNKVVEVPVEFKTRIHGETTQTFQRFYTDVFSVLSIPFYRTGKSLKSLFSGGRK